MEYPFSRNSLRPQWIKFSSVIFLRFIAITIAIFADVFNICFLILLMIIYIYLFWYVICTSFSKASLLMGHPGILFNRWQADQADHGGAGAVSVFTEVFRQGLTEEYKL